MKKVWWYGYSETFQRQMTGFVDMMFGRCLSVRIKGLFATVSAHRRKNRL